MHRGTDHLRAALDDRLAPADRSVVGLDPAEQPTRRNKKGLHA
jgi:hypothetical protein